jgi:hypothetical protein
MPIDLLIYNLYKLQSLEDAMLGVEPIMCTVFWTKKI